MFSLDLGNPGVACAWPLASAKRPSLACPTARRQAPFPHCTASRATLAKHTPQRNSHLAMCRAAPFRTAPPPLSTARRCSVPASWQPRRGLRAPAAAWAAVSHPPPRRTRCCCERSGAFRSAHAQQLRLRSQGRRLRPKMLVAAWAGPRGGGIHASGPAQRSRRRSLPHQGLEANPGASRARVFTRGKLLRRPSHVLRQRRRVGSGGACYSGRVGGGSQAHPLSSVGWCRGACRACLGERGYA